MKKRFERNLNNRILGGVASGIGDYLSIDPKFVRVAFLVGTLIPPFFASFVIYCIFWILMPESKVKKTKKNRRGGGSVIDIDI